MDKSVVLCIPTTNRPFQQCIDSLDASIKAIKEAGWTLHAVSEIGNPYISGARSAMLRKALDVTPDVVVFIDHDLSFPPDAILRLIETSGDVVAGTYRFKREPEEYMGALLPDIHGRPQVRADGCVKAHCIPAGFMKITRNGVNRFMAEYPELCYGERSSPCIDLFNHGAHQWTWYGEDYAFSRRWTEMGGEIWVIPDLDLTHHSKDADYPANYHQFLMRQEGGSESANPVEPPPKPEPVLIPAAMLRGAA